MTKNIAHTPETLDDLALRAAVLNVLKGRVTQAEKDTKETIARMFRAGGNVKVVSPVDGKPIATVTKAVDTRRAVVVARGDLDEWVSTHYPEKVETVTGVDPAQVGDLLDYLRENAPWFIQETRRVPDWVVNELVVKSTEVGEVVGWGGECGENAPAGIEVVTAQGTVRVTIDKNGGAELVDQLWADGAIDFDGNRIEIENAKEDA